MLAATAAWSQFDHTHAAWSALLNKHVVNIDGGKASPMRYAEIAKDRAALKTYVDTLAKVSEADFKGWSKNRQLAFLINDYNAEQQIIIRDGNAEIRHLDYDWALNDVKK